MGNGIEAGSLTIGVRSGMEPEQNHDRTTDSNRQLFDRNAAPAYAPNTGADQARDADWLGPDSAFDEGDARRLRLRVSALEELLHTRSQELADMRRVLEHSVVREQRARVRAETLLEREQQLWAAIAQELRGPLSSVAGWLQLLGRNQTGRPERALVSLTRNVRVLTRLVDDLVDHARCEIGGIEPNSASWTPHCY
jgi:signal transduction histidine kinase